MTMAELEISLDDDLVVRTRGLALRYFGDSNDASLAQVLEVAFRMRRLWSSLMKEGQAETDEAVSQWEFAESPVNKENNDTVKNWLFRR